MDLSKVSDDDLKAFSSGNYSKISDEGLRQITGAHAEAAQASPPPGDVNNPLEADLYSKPGEGMFDPREGLRRAKASFGDTAGVGDMLKEQGFKNTQRNKSDDLVAQGPNGKFYKDQTGLFSHPVNWLESKAGGSLPTAGLVAGGIAGEGVGSIPLAGAGAAVGEGGRVAIGKALGSYKGGVPDAMSDVASEGLKGALAETGGKVLGAIPLPGGLNVGEAQKLALEKLVAGGKSVATKASQILTGVDGGAFLRALERPTQVRTALAPGNALAVARQGQDELAARATSEGTAISNARQAFAQKYGHQPMNTEQMIQAAKDAIQRNLPNSSGKSGMTPSELEELQGVISGDFTTNKVTGQAASQVQTPSKILGPDGQPMMKTQTVTTPVTTPIPQKNAGELQKTADWMQEQINPSNYNNSGPNRSGKIQGAYQELLGKIKDAFHRMDPNGLGAADARFSDYANKTKILGPIENDATGESFASNLFGANKGAKQEAAKALIPKTYEGMADIGAKKAMEGGRLKGLGGFSPSGPSLLRGGVTLGAGAAGMAATGGSLGGGALGLGLGGMVNLATSPNVHAGLYYLAGKYGMPAVEKMIANPQVAATILDSVDLKKLQGMVPNNWSQVKGNPQ